jgi:hypothetical protein
VGYTPVLSLYSNVVVVRVTTQTTNGGECDCPLCGGFSGSPSQVEAHISSKADDLHRGTVGKNHREELVAEPVEDDDPAGTTSYESSSEGLAEAGETTGLSGLDVGPGTAVLAGTVVVALVVLLETATASDDQPEASGEDVDGEEGEAEATAGGMLA